MNVPQAALWGRLTTLSTRDGARKVAETWAIAFERQHDGAVRKTALKNTFPATGSAKTTDGAIGIHGCQLAEGKTSGNVSGHGHTLSWDLRFQPNSYTFFHVPEAIQKLGLSKSTVCKPNMDIRMSGAFTIDGRAYAVDGAPGCQGHVWGTGYPDSWAWAHGNAFEGAEPCVFEILTARVSAGGILPLPRMSAVFLEFRGKRYAWNGLGAALFSTCHEIYPTSWKFKGRSGGLSIRGEARCTPEDLAGVTYEDPRGGKRYCYNSSVASIDLEIVPGAGEPAVALACRGNAALETVTKRAFPQAELLL